MPFLAYIKNDIKWPSDASFIVTPKNKLQAGRKSVEQFKILKKSWSQSKIKNNLILYFNHLLEKKANYFSLNETELENLIDRLNKLVYYKDVSYWLTMARLNELTLLCAENYANNGELSLVGALLLNPRLILVHIRGEKRPVIKKRHTLLTEQFRCAGETVQEVIEWLKTETFLETKVEALLPDLQKILEKSGYFSQEYFASLHERKVKVTELTGFLANSGLDDGFDLYQQLRQASPADRKLLESKLCPCNQQLFYELGRQIKVLAQEPSASVGFENWKVEKREGGMMHV